MSTIDQYAMSQMAEGLNLDYDPLTAQEGDYGFVMNGAHTHRYGNMVFMGNYEGNAFSDGVPFGYYIIGSKLISEDENVIFSTNPLTGDSEIGLFKSDKYSTVVNARCLNFRINYQIQAEFKRSGSCGDMIYFTDDFNNMRFMNIRNPPVDSNGNLDCSRLDLFKIYTTPCLTIDRVLETGKLKSGMYFITMQYADENGSGLTPWIDLKGGVPIYSDSTSSTYEKLNGSPPDIITNKSIQVNISNVDTFYEFYNIGVIQVVNGVKTAFRIGPINVSQVDYIITGVDTAKSDIDLTDITTRPAIYKRAKTVEAIGDVLMWGNLTSRRQLNLQSYINQIEVQWSTYKVRANSVLESYKNPINTTYRKSFLRDEVYPLGFVGVFDDGSETIVYPLIPRTLNTKSNGTAFTSSVDQYGNPVSAPNWDDDPVVAGANDDIYEGGALPRWKVYNTATIEGSFGVGSEDEGCYQYGEMAYWEAENARYPNKPEIWGDVAGEKIRHFKFPDCSIAHIHDGEAFNRGVKEYPFLYLLGIRLPNIENVLASMPDDIRSQLKGWKIVRGDRTYQKSIVAKGLIYNCYNVPFDLNDRRYYPAWPFNDVRGYNDYAPNAGMWGYTDNPDPWYTDKIGYTPATGGFLADAAKDVYMMHSPDPSFLRVPIRSTELKIESMEYGNASGAFQYIDWFPDLRVHAGNKDTDKMMVQYEAEGWYNNYLKPDYGQVRRRLKDALYAPSGEQISTGSIGLPLHNRIRESGIVLGINGTIDFPAVEDNSTLRLGEEACDINVSHTTNISSYYAALKNPLPDQYGSIYDINWVNMNYCTDRFPKECIMGGDTFIGMFTLKRKHAWFLCAENYRDGAEMPQIKDLVTCQNIPGTKYGYYSADRTFGWEVRGEEGACSITGDKGIIPLYYYGVPCFFCEATTNVDLRYETDDSSTAYYPSLRDSALNFHQWMLRSVTEDNSYLYNRDYSEQNNMVPFMTYTPSFDPENECLEDFDTRVIYSPRAGANDINDNWQIYKPLDFYDFPKNKGELVDIRYIGMGKALFRLEDSLYLYGAYTTLQTSDKPIQLGSGNMFEREPQELKYTDIGYAGTRSQWAYNSTPFGEFMIDDKRGKVFMYSEQTGLVEISNFKTYNWFQENLPLKLYRDVPGYSEVDNPANPTGIGFNSVFDHRYKLWILSKKDYELIDKSLKNRISYRNGYIYIDEQQVSLDDRRYFANRSWTISYSPEHRRWKSFHSFLPDGFIVSHFGYYTTKESGIWSHNVKDLYCTYYGKHYPFIAEPIIKTQDAGTNVLNSISFVTRCFEYGEVDSYELLDETFNKVNVYNTDQMTGMLELSVRDMDDLSTYFQLPETMSQQRVIPIARTEHNWNISDLYDIIKNRQDNTPMFTNNWENDDFFNAFPIDKVINEQAVDYNKEWTEAQLLRNKWAKARFYYDKSNRNKLIAQFFTGNMRQSKR